MNGNNKAEHGILGIIFSEFYVHPDYFTTQPINQKDFEWLLFTDFRIDERKTDWDYVTIELKVKLERKSDKILISELKTESSYKVTAGMSFDYKYKMICMLINTTVGHLQGGWVIKHINPNLKSFLPQAFYKESSVEDYLKKNVYERWD